MNLVIDLGNTKTKAAIFDGQHLVKKFIFEKNASAEIKILLVQYPTIQYSILSSVINDIDEITAFLKAQTHCVNFDVNTPLSFKITYTTPETLGKDRIAAVAGAIALHPLTPLLVIDAGTCIKYNFVNAQSEFVGGAISPGLDMRFKALSVFTDKLPHLNYEVGFNEIIGTSTKNSLLSGVQQGILFELEGYITFFKEQNKNGIVLAMGGNVSFLVDALKNSIFAAPDLILSGLNEILLHHIKE